MKRLVVLILVCACKSSHASLPTKGERTEAAPPIVETIYDRGLGPDWNDYGWAPRTFDQGKPAIVDMHDKGGWIICKPKLSAQFGALIIAYEAAASYGDFLEVRVDSSRSDVFPRIKIAAQHLLDQGDGKHEALVRMQELNPHGLPFDRIVLRAHKALAAPANVTFTRIGFAAAAPGEARSAARAGVESRRVTKTPLSVRCDAPGHAVSPLIFGIALKARTDAEDTYLWELNPASRRWGGNPSSRYNWQLGNAWNTAVDWFFKNTALTSNTAYGHAQFISDNLLHGAKTALTVPTLGWVAKDRSSYAFPVGVYGAQQQTAPENDDAGNGVSQKGVELEPGTPLRTSMQAPPAFIAQWVKSLRAADVQRGARGVHSYILDNEPALWNSTHRDVHPLPVTYDELLERTLGYGRAVREADPDARIAGPAEWGWPAYFFSAADQAAGFKRAPDRRAHGDVPLLAWLITKLAEFRQRTGVRILDTIDVHFYPAGKGIFGEQAGLDPDTSARRVRSVRALWDPSYEDESWINEKVALLPRLKHWIDERDPGLGISIGEYNFGAEEHMSGGVALAEALGRFSDAGIESAYYWTYPPKDSPAYWAFRAFRNYDGKGGHFLGRHLPTQSLPDVSLFASRDDASGRIVLVAVNLGNDATAEAAIALQGCGAPSAVRTFLYTGEAGGLVEQAKGALQLSLPPYSIAVFEITQGR